MGSVPYQPPSLKWPSHSALDKSITEPIDDENDDWELPSLEELLAKGSRAAIKDCISAHIRSSLSRSIQENHSMEPHTHPEPSGSLGSQATAIGPNSGRKRIRTIGPNRESPSRTLRSESPGSQAMPILLSDDEGPPLVDRLLLHGRKRVNYLIQ